MCVYTRTCAWVCVCKLNPVSSLCWRLPCRPYYWERKGGIMFVISWHIFYYFSRKQKEPFSSFKHTRSIVTSCPWQFYKLNHPSSSHEEVTSFCTLSQLLLSTHVIRDWTLSLFYFPHLLPGRTTLPLIVHFKCVADLSFRPFLAINSNSIESLFL